MASSSQHRGISQSSPSSSSHRTLPQSSPSGAQHHTMSQSSPSSSQHRTMLQSSPSGSHQPSVSQPSQLVGDNTSQSSNDKLPIIVHADSRVTGDYGGKWSSKVGYWIRAIVPISYASWDKVDDSFKDEVWLKLMDKSNPKKKHKRTDGWKYGHKHRIGTVLKSAQECYGILEHVRLNGSANGQPSTPTAVVDSTSIPRTQQVPNSSNRNGSLNPPSRSTSFPKVKILGRKGEHVANGYVKTDNQKCRFRDIMVDEKVVYITNVLVGDTLVYDGPQDDILYLRDIADGIFLIWAGCRLQYED
ncbi:hypothetical protein IFM89_015095 [Coptis chinensis]|uniref:Uncharacterized protein n=1 Tax=Coptis chinensis TaxID=261450 RepID=A0A835IP05_9MAGN|nr:hypothetical protein IFM89_015095 [Coptis chinensis]